MKIYDFSGCDFDDDKLLGKKTKVLVFECRGNMLRMVVSVLPKKRLVFVIPQREITERTGYTVDEAERIIDTMEGFRAELIDGIKAAEKRS